MASPVPTKDEIMLWSPERIYQWLIDLKMPSLAEVFLVNGIKGASAAFSADMQAKTSWIYVKPICCPWA
jgi:hypothetical protein